jgi:hypothetical protein
MAAAGGGWHGSGRRRAVSQQRALGGIAAAGAGRYRSSGRHGSGARAVERGTVGPGAPGVRGLRRHRRCSGSPSIERIDRPGSRLRGPGLWADAEWLVSCASSAPGSRGAQVTGRAAVHRPPVVYTDVGTRAPGSELRPGSEPTHESVIEVAARGPRSSSMSPWLVQVYAAPGRGRRLLIVNIGEINLMSELRVLHGKGEGSSADAADGRGPRAARAVEAAGRQAAGRGA